MLLKLSPKRLKLDVSGMGISFREIRGAGRRGEDRASGKRRIRDIAGLRRSRLRVHQSEMEYMSSRRRVSRVEELLDER